MVITKKKDHIITVWDAQNKMENVIKLFMVGGTDNLVSVAVP
jgi:hypothetical protein